MQLFHLVKESIFSAIFFTTFHQQRYPEFQRWFQANDIINTRIHASVTLGTNHLTWRGQGLWFLASFRIFFSDNTRVRIFFFCRAKREFLFQNLTLGYITKTLIRLFFFTPPKSEYFFQSNIGNQNILLEKKHNPLPSS